MEPRYNLIIPDIIIIKFELIILSESTYEYILYSICILLLLIIVVYRATSWKEEKLYLLDKEIIYSRGKFKKKTSTIILEDISYVEVRLFQFVVHTKSEKQVIIPACFTNLIKVYAILKYYRQKK